MKAFVAALMCLSVLALDVTVGDTVPELSFSSVKTVYPVIGTATTPG